MVDMNYVYIQIVLMCCILLLTACGSTGPETSPAPIPDTEISLYHGSLLDNPEVIPVAANRLDPGQSERQPRPFPDAPPVVPHRTDDFLPITLSENLCLGCHDRANAAELEAPATPASHYLDLRQDPVATRDQVAGARYLCTSCHVGRSAAVPLVDNRSR